MGDHGEIDPKVGLSRRAALRAGVAAGVGAAVWSGVSITSLGGTPAYAAGCTFPTVIDLTGSTGCRNIDQGNCPNGPGTQDLYAYHVLKSALPAPFTLTQNITEGTCCEDVPSGGLAPQFNFPSGWTCTVTLEMSAASQGKCGPNPNLTRYFPGGNPPVPGGSTTLVPVVGPASIAIDLICYPLVGPGWFYTIYANCVNDGTGEGC